MRHRALVDKTIDPSTVDKRSVLEQELHAVSDRLPLTKKLTLGYAIHILSMVDRDASEAEQVHTTAVVEAIEAFRGRIAELAEGKVKPPKRGSETKPVFKAAEVQPVAPAEAPPSTVMPARERPKKKSDARPLPRLTALPTPQKPVLPQVPVKSKAVVNAGPAKPRSDEDRRRDFTTSAALRFTGAVKEDWTFEHALDIVCDHFAQMPKRMLFRVFGGERFPQDQYYELLRIGTVALRSAATRFDPMRDGEITQFLEAAVRGAYKSLPPPQRESADAQPVASDAAVVPHPLQSNGSTQRIDVRPPAEIAKGVLKMYLGSAARKAESVPLTHFADFEAFARSLGVEGVDHQDRLTQIAGRHFHIAEELARALLPPDGRFKLQQLRDLARYVIVKFTCEYEPGHGDFESGLRSAVEERLRSKIRGEK